MLIVFGALDGANTSLKKIKHTKIKVVRQKAKVAIELTAAMCFGWLGVA
jgi:hypothetical protein